MKRHTIFFVIISSLCSLQAYAQSQAFAPPKTPSQQNPLHAKVTFVTAYKVYTKWTVGRAIIVQAGGEAFNRRHVMGAVNIPQELVDQGKWPLPKLPRTKIEIFIYCY